MARKSRGIARRSRPARTTKARSLDLAIKVRAKSIVSLEWGCAYAFPVPAAQAVPLVVVSELYRSPRAPDEAKA